MPLEVRALEVAAQEIAGAKLADAKVGGRRRLLKRSMRAELLALHLQSSAPFRHT